MGARHGGGQAGDVGDLRQLRLEVAFDGDRPSGAVIAEDGERRPFDGWTGFAGAIVAVVPPGHQDPQAEENTDGF